MSKLEKFLKMDYRDKIKKAHTACPGLEDLHEYAQGTINAEDRDRIERHLSVCYRCLDTIIAMRKIKEGHSYKRG
jgi:anti-sigma factor RsiW